MRKIKIYNNKIFAGILEEFLMGTEYKFTYNDKYSGPPVSLTMPLSKKEYYFNVFPPFFDGLLPEGIMLEGLLKKMKIDRNDNLSQLIAVGKDMIGTLTIEEIK